MDEEQLIFVGKSFRKKRGGHHTLPFLGEFTVWGWKEAGKELLTLHYGERT